MRHEAENVTYDNVALLPRAALMPRRETLVG